MVDIGIRKHEEESGKSISRLRRLMVTGKWTFVIDGLVVGISQVNGTVPETEEYFITSIIV